MLSGLLARMLSGLIKMLGGLIKMLGGLVKHFVVTNKLLDCIKHKPLGTPSPSAISWCILVFSKEMVVANFLVICR